MKIERKNIIMAEKSKTYIITGDAFWAKLLTPNTKFEPVWSVDVSHLDNATVKSLKGMGLNPRKCDKQENNRGNYITLKRKVRTAAGKDKNPPLLKDSKNNDWDGSLIGNGSKINAKFHVYTNSYGTFAELDAVQVVKLVEYTKTDFDPVEGGYTVGGGSSTELSM